MSPKFLLRSIKFLIFIAVIGTPLFYFRWGVYPYTLSKQLFFQAVVELIFFLWLALAIQDKKYRPKWTPFTIGFTVFLSLLTFVALIGVDPWRSFWSTYERALGVVAVYHLAALALVLFSLSREIPWKKLFYASLATAVVLDIIAWIQLHHDNVLLNESSGGRPGSSFGNPSFFADYLLFNIFIAVFLLLDRWRNKEETGILDSHTGKTSAPSSWYGLVFLCTALALNVSALFLAQTRGDIIGLAVGVFMLLLFFAVHPPRFGLRIFSSRRFYSTIAAIIVLFGATFWFTRHSAVWSNIPGLRRFSDISSLLTTDEFLPRRAALTAAWEGFVEKPLFGWGPENFNVVFNKHYDPKVLEISYGETRFDKPHNFVMEYLVSGGVPLLVAYFGLFGLFLLESWRLKDRLWTGIAIATITAYAVSDIFVFETIGGVLMLYLLFGFVNGKYAERNTPHDPVEKKSEKEKNNAESRLRGGILPHISYGCLAIGLICVYGMNILSLEASYDQYLGFNNIVNGHQAAGVGNFRDAIATWSPYRWNFERDFAAEVAQIYFYNPGYISDADVRDGMAAMEDSRDAHPLDAYNHYALIDMYNEVSALRPPGPQTFLCEAEREAKIALTLSPNRQEIFFSLAKTKSIEGSENITECDGQPIEGGTGNGAALDILKKALDLDPKVPEAHFYYGLLAFAIGDASVDYDIPRMTLGYNELETAIQMGRKWKNYYEPRAVADYFADFSNATRDPKYLDQAIELYKEALDMQPGDAETEIKLGVAYYVKGDPDSARKNLLDAGKKFDFTKSADYGHLKPILDALGIRNPSQ